MRDPNLIVGGRMKGNCKHSGFSLVEILAVMTIISVLIGLGVASTRGIGASRNLSVGADIVATLGTQARQYAVSHNSITALVVAGKSAPKEHALRSFAIFELNRSQSGETLSSQDWKQLSQWKRLPDGIVVDPSSRFLSSSSINPTPRLPSVLQAGGAAVTDFAVQSYLPSGRLMNDVSPNIKIVSGYLENGSLFVTGPKNGVDPIDYINISFIASTGQTKVFRP